MISRQRIVMKSKHSRILRPGDISDMRMLRFHRFCNSKQQFICGHTIVCISLMMCVWDVDVFEEWTFPRWNHWSSLSSLSSSSSSSPWSTEIDQTSKCKVSPQANSLPSTIILHSNIEMQTEPTSKLAAQHPNSKWSSHIWSQTSICKLSPQADSRPGTLIPHAPLTCAWRMLWWWLGSRCWWKWWW